MIGHHGQEMPSANIQFQDSSFEEHDKCSDTFFSPKVIMVLRDVGRPHRELDIVTR